jgi:hypothetical protein
MNKMLTPRQLLEKIPDAEPAETVIAVEADIALEGTLLNKLIVVLTEDTSIAGLEIVTADDTSLGIIPIDAFLDYVDSQSYGTGSMGGLIGQLEGDPVLPMFQCTIHQPPYRRLVGIQRPEPPCCRICGKPMQLVEDA